MNKNFIFVMQILIFIVGITLFSYNVYTGIIKNDWGYIIEQFIVLGIILTISWIFVFRMPRERAHKLTQYIGFPCFFIWLLFPSNPFWLYFFILGIGGISLSIILKRDIKPREGGATLDEKIKNQLKINARSIKMSLPWKIGGFVTPALPLFHVVSNKWKGVLKKEAIIHENVHLYYLQNGWLVAIIFFILLIGVQVMKIVPSGFDMSLFIFFMFMMSMVFFEYITFNKTYKIGQNMGIATRQWNWKIAFSYFKIYTLQLIIIFFIYHAFKFMFIIIKGMF